MYDFLFDFYGHHLPISYRSRDNAGHNFEGRKMASIEILRMKIGSAV